MFGLRGVGLEFFAQMRDVDSQVMRLFHCLRPPDFRQQLAVRQNLAGVRDEQSQQPLQSESQSGFANFVSSSRGVRI